MAEQDEPADAVDDLDRIDAALDRIAAGRTHAASPAMADATVISARLDGLIARLRDALAFGTG